MPINSSSEISIEKNTIIQTINPDIKEINLEIAKSLTDEVMAVSENKEYVLIFDMNRVTYANSDARIYYRNIDLMKNIKAIAILAENETPKLVAKVIFYSKKNFIPVEVFKHKADALEWLNKLSLVH
jgi:hypothetical protein